MSFALLASLAGGLNKMFVGEAAQLVGACSLLAANPFGKEVK